MPAGTPVVIKGDAGYYTFKEADSTPANATDNDLNYSASALTTDGTQWVLAKLDGGVGFAKATPETTIKAYKAYLVISGSGTAKDFIQFDATTTAIKAIVGAGNGYGAAPNYNLSGQRVPAGYKGVVIKDGKKVIIK